MTDLQSVLQTITPNIRTILEHCLEGKELKQDDATTLFSVTGPELTALVLTADYLRELQCGDQVSYVVNRNINFTNVCIKTCQFCAFSRDLRSEEGYFLPTDEIIRRAQEALSYGATEVCLQAGLAPSIDGEIYIDLCRELHQALPKLHLHAFSPEEVKYGAIRSKRTFYDYLSALKDAGIGSLPGTSAEILNDTLRKRISPGRISTQEWIQIVTTAHKLGIPTTSTMMFGHVETKEERAAHMALLRDIQKQTGGFTEFVPLSFVHQEAPLFIKQDITGVQPGPTGNDIIRMYAIARLMLGATIKNIQASWVKEGLRMASWLLNCGVNDLGGTLMNESISTTAGASHGQLMTPAMLRHAIRDAGRVPVERRTTYEIHRQFSRVLEEQEIEQDPLSQLEHPQEIFGSYQELTTDQTFTYKFENAL
ncbi:FO synthase-like [Ylistrum balloti]|uniref:FO synthase-like n=1 Tax=Ylistrum balloti TaxID=509963 RepID=UPI002905CA73|nr:FO synthase-like [Ylistrum balloti]